MKHVAPLLAALLLCASCLGPNRLANRVKGWEPSTEPAAVVVYLVSTPLLHVAYAIDILVLNVLDYWSGPTDSTVDG